MVAKDLKPQFFLRLQNAKNGLILDTWVYFRYNYYTMKFEYDPVKSKKNKKKHSLGFEEARELWDDPALLEIPAKTEDEPRYIVIGRIKEKHWSAICTNRESTIRIISIRRSRKEEVVLYES